MFHLNIFQVCDDYNSARHHYEEIDNNKYQVLTKPFFRFRDSDLSGTYARNHSIIKYFINLDIP